MDKEFKKKIVDCYNATELLFEENVITGDKRDEYERSLLHQVAGRYAIELQSKNNKEENKEISNKEEPKKFCGKELGDIVNCTILKSSNLPSELASLPYSYNMQICYMNSKKICLLGCDPITKLIWEEAINFHCDISIPAGELLDEELNIDNVSIPTLKNIYFTTANYRRDFNYWISTPVTCSNAWYVEQIGCVDSIIKNTSLNVIPYVTINL